MQCSSCDPDLFLWVTPGIQGPDMCHGHNTALFLGLKHTVFSALQHRGTTMSSTTMIKTDKSAVRFSGLGLSALCLLGLSGTAGGTWEDIVK